MIGDIKKAFGKSVVYSLGNMSTKLIGLVLIPLYTDQDYLSVSDYGALGVLEITSQVPGGPHESYPLPESDQVVLEQGLHQ